MSGPQSDPAARLPGIQVTGQKMAKSRLMFNSQVEEIQTDSEPSYLERARLRWQEKEQGNA